MSQSEPLISILIGAFKPTYFAECIESALGQTWMNFELIVADDGPGPEIEEMTRRYAQMDHRVRYYRNPTNLGGRQNFINLFNEASGEMIKYLCDDDRLDSRCLERMAACLEAYPDVTLVTSYRRFIDERGQEGPHVGRAPRVGAEDCRVNGRAVINRLMRTLINFVGEPTTGMFRKRDLADVQPDIFSFAGEKHVTNVDVVMWMNLLMKGNAIFLSEPMSDFRRHPDQEQLNEFTRREAPKVWYALVASATKLGLLSADGRADLPVEPLGTMRPWWSEEVQAQVHRAEVVLENGDIEQALRSLTEARSLAPAEAWISVLLGGLRLVTGDPAGALADYQEALTMSPDHPRILTNVASALMRVGGAADLDLARQLASNAARMCPDDPDAQGLLGELVHGQSAAASPPG